MELKMGATLNLNNHYSSQSSLFFLGCLLVFVVNLVSCVNYMGIKSNKKITPPAQFQTKKSLPDQQGRWPTMNWAKEFGDPQLVLLISEALQNNPSLDVAKARIVQAKALAEQRATVFLPSANFTTQVARGRLSETLFPPLIGGGMWYNFGEFLSSASYELDFWGKNLASHRQAIYQQRAAEAAEQEARLSIATAVASAYNQLSYYYDLRHVLRLTVTQREDLDKISSIRLKTGLDTKVQYFQSRNTTANAKTQLHDVEGQILLTRQQLGTLLGKGPDRGLAIKRPRLKAARTPQLPSNLPLNLLGRRPDIVNAHWTVEAACQGVKNTQAKFYPDINIMGIAGLLSLGISRIFEQASAEYQIGPALKLPIFDAGNLRAQLRGQYGNYEEAVASYNTTLNNALSDVASQITSIHSTNEQLKTQKQALYTSKHAYNLARLQYRTGLASQLVVLNAETLYLSAQQTLLQLTANRKNQQIALIKALGGGFNAYCHAANHKAPKDK